MTREVMIRFCVGKKGSRRAIAEWWCNEGDLLEIIRDTFEQCPDITLAQAFDENEDFLRQYERV